jgi:DNA polymerase
MIVYAALRRFEVPPPALYAGLARRGGKGTASGYKSVKMNNQLSLFDDAPSSGPFADIEAAREAARACMRCDLAASRQQVVFGAGRVGTRLMIVGEGPSEADDSSGQPFSGPSGRQLDRWLTELGLSRADVWLTNVVRCRPSERDGNRLKNRPPRSGEVQACRIWMDAERALVQPSLVLCVGATAGRALLGRDFKMTRDRGRWLALDDGTPVLATYNPAYVLRLEGDARDRAEAEVALDLASVRGRLGA